MQTCSLCVARSAEYQSNPFQRQSASPHHGHASLAGLADASMVVAIRANAWISCCDPITPVALIASNRASIARAPGERRTSSRCRFRLPHRVTLGFRRTPRGGASYCAIRARRCSHHGREHADAHQGIPVLRARAKLVYVDPSRSVHATCQRTHRLSDHLRASGQRSGIFNSRPV